MTSWPKLRIHDYSRKTITINLQNKYPAMVFLPYTMTCGEEHYFCALKVCETFRKTIERFRNSSQSLIWSRCYIRIGYSINWYSSKCTTSSIVPDRNKLHSISMQAIAVCFRGASDIYLDSMEEVETISFSIESYFLSR